MRNKTKVHVYPDFFSPLCLVVNCIAKVKTNVVILGNTGNSKDIAGDFIHDRLCS